MCGRLFPAITETLNSFSSFLSISLLSLLRTTRSSVFCFLRAGSSDSLSDPLSWSSDSGSESAGALSSPLALFFTLSNAPKLQNPSFISTARPEKASLRRAATSVVWLWPGVADCCKPLPVRRSFGALFPLRNGWVLFQFSWPLLSLKRRSQ